MILYNKPINNFTMIGNQILQDSTLTLQARAIYALMRSYGVKWRFNAKYLAKICAVSKTTFYKYINELLEKDLIRRVQLKAKRGQWSEIVYIFSDADEIVEADIDINKMDTGSIKNIKQKTQTALDDLTKEMDATYSKINSTKKHKEEALDSISIDTKQEQDNDPVGVKKDCIQKSSIYNNIYSIKKEEYVEREEKEDSKQESKGLKDRTKINYFGVINLKDLLEKCNKVIRDRKSKELAFKDEQDRKEMDFKRFLSQNEIKAYEDFIAYRQEKKKLSDTTKSSIQKRLLALKEDKEDICEIINRSLMNGWTGLFPLQKSKFQKAPNRNKQLTAEKQREVFVEIFGEEPKSLEELQAELMERVGEDIQRERESRRQA